MNDSHPTAHDASRNTQAPVQRRPFEPPTVQNLGGLTLLTLVSGGGSI